MTRREFIAAGTASGIIAGCRLPIGTGKAKHWYKGSLHCHTYWSDGRAFPEQALTWYRNHGYQFVALTDHNTFEKQNSRWLLEKSWPETDRFVDEYLRDFPRADWRLDAKGERELRLKPFAELSREFNAAGDFLLLPGCELTHWCKQADADKVIRRELHMNVVGLDETMPYLRHPDFKINDNKTWGRDDTAVAAYIADLSRQVSAFAKELGVSQPYFSLNHPVWPWYDIQPEDLIANPSVRFFEVCNNGSATPPPKCQPADGLDTDRFWDVVNAFRARRGQPLLYGTGTDDAHYYFGKMGERDCNAGSAWTRVQAEELSQTAILSALAAGNFIACEGVEFSEVEFDSASRTLQVAVEAIADRRLTVEFIVSKKDFSEKPKRTQKVHPVDFPNFVRTFNFYDSKIGCVAKRIVTLAGEPLRAAYTLQPDDLYVRARLSVAGTPVCGDYLHPRARHVSWTQPYL